MMPRTLPRLLPAAAIALLATACSRPAGPYPSRDIKIIVQSTPGGLSDAVSRVLASVMEKQLGVPVICENRPGAAGALAFSFVTRQPPTGYLLGHGPVEIAMVQTLGFAPVGPEDMDLLCLVTRTKPVLAVRSGSPWRTFEDFLETARARPGYYIVANSGTGSIWHVNALLLERGTGLRLVHCPFSGSSAALTALLGGHVDAAVAGAGEVSPHAKAGVLRPLSVFDPSRSPLFPETPTVAESGYSFGVSAWSGFYGPKGLPDGVTAALVAAFRAAFDSREFQGLCQERGMEPVFLGPIEFREFAFQQASFFRATIPDLIAGGGR
jgi:tripartite-type tricarboxylate transporter receptor subunit TctC